MYGYVSFREGIYIIYTFQGAPPFFAPKKNWSRSTADSEEAGPRPRPRGGPFRNGFSYAYIEVKPDNQSPPRNDFRKSIVKRAGVIVVI